MQLQNNFKGNLNERLAKAITKARVITARKLLFLESRVILKLGKKTIGNKNIHKRVDCFKTFKDVQNSIHKNNVPAFVSIASGAMCGEYTVFKVTDDYACYVETKKGKIFFIGRMKGFTKCLIVFRRMLEKIYSDGFSEIHYRNTQVI